MTADDASTHDRRRDPFSGDGWTPLEARVWRNGYTGELLPLRAEWERLGRWRKFWDRLQGKQPLKLPPDQR